MKYLILAAIMAASPVALYAADPYPMSEPTPRAAPIVVDMPEGINLVWGFKAVGNNLLPQVCWDKNKCTVMPKKINTLWVSLKRK